MTNTHQTDRLLCKFEVSHFQNLNFKIKNSVAGYDTFGNNSKEDKNTYLILSGKYNYLLLLSAYSIRKLLKANYT